MKKILIGLTAVLIMACMTGSALATVGPGLSPGFWKHNLGVYLGHENGGYSDPIYYPGVDPVVTRLTMHDFLALKESQGWNLEYAYQILSAKGGGDIAQARIDMANLLNQGTIGLDPYVEP